MKTIEVYHPDGQWVEILKSNDEQEIQAYLNRYVIGMGLRCRVIG